MNPCYAWLTIGAFGGVVIGTLLVWLYWGSRLDKIKEQEFRRGLQEGRKRWE